MVSMLFQLPLALPWQNMFHVSDNLSRVYSNWPIDYAASSLVPLGPIMQPSLISPDPVKLEESYLQKLEICKADYSSQIVEPEHTLRLLLEMNVAFGIMANLADDLRNLQRTEIAEISEFFGTDQVGSSTMPQKRNPWNSEHVKSLWKTFAPRVFSFFMDQISEHQERSYQFRIKSLPDRIHRRLCGCHLPHAQDNQIP